MSPVGRRCGAIFYRESMSRPPLHVASNPSTAGALFIHMNIRSDSTTIREGFLLAKTSPSCYLCDVVYLHLPEHYDTSICWDTKTCLDITRS
jgi:hypothetical protein